LAEAEAQWDSAGGLARLTEGLGLLDDVLSAGRGAEPRTAGNVASSYAARFYDRIRTLLDHDEQVPEPELLHCFKLVLAFDQVAGALPPESAELKIAVVRALVDRYYEGHPPERKRAALEQLVQLGRQR
jgi:hypothetical protein